MSISCSGYHRSGRKFVLENVLEFALGIMPEFALGIMPEFVLGIMPEFVLGNMPEFVLEVLLKVLLWARALGKAEVLDRI